MTRLIIIIIAGLYFIIGLVGFFKPNLIYLVQFDFFQSFCYLVIGVCGLKISLTKQPQKSHLQKYLSGVTIFSFGLMMLGLIWPNLADIVHLEVAEHFFHGSVGLLASLTASFNERYN